jgi:hypothetical protein
LRSTLYSEVEVNAMDDRMTGCARAAALAAGLAAVAAAACSSGSTGASAGPKDAGGETGQEDAGTTQEAGEPAFSCDAGCAATTLADATCVETVQASLVDGTGTPVAGQDLLVCGDNLCSLPGQTNTQGSTEFFLCEQMLLPALKFIAGPSYVSFASAVTQADTTFAPITLVPLPASGVAFPSAAGTITSGQVSLTVAAGAVTFDPSQPTDANTQAFRAAQVDIAKTPVPITASLGIAAVWGLAPVNATLSPAASLTLPNTQGWAAGSKVDLYMNGVDPIANAPVPYGSWGPVGTGTVSQDGTTITTDTGSGNGILVLSMVGVSPHS